MRDESVILLRNINGTLPLPVVPTPAFYESAGMYGRRGNGGGTSVSSGDWSHSAAAMKRDGSAIERVAVLEYVPHSSYSTFQPNPFLLLSSLRVCDWTDKPTHSLLIFYYVSVVGDFGGAQRVERQLGDSQDHLDFAQMYVLPNVCFRFFEHLLSSSPLCPL
jgi:hypothetical protein